MASCSSVSALDIVILAFWAVITPTLIPPAIADYTTIIKLNPRYLDVYGKRADLKKDLKGAIADYGQMIKVAPQNVTPYMEQASLYLKQNRYSGAIANDTKLIELQSSDIVWYFSRAQARKSTGDRPGASLTLAYSQNLF
jgi:tetratricopeptide (TPR) repeat protein